MKGINFNFPSTGGRELKGGGNKYDFTKFNRADTVVCPYIPFPLAFAFPQ